FRKNLFTAPPLGRRLAATSCAAKILCWRHQIVPFTAMAGRGRHSAQSRRYELSRKVKKFVKGLKPSLKARLLEYDPCTLEEVLVVARKQENRVESYQEEKEAQKKGVSEPF
ncbi:hypothetical protein Taro_040251, partial [Colocasia esculenta]|nr:hypothetical protein [Colocasia esculenta]